MRPCFVYDIKNPQQISFAGQAPSPLGNLNTLSVVDNFAFTTKFLSGMRCLDLSDPDDIKALDLTNDEFVFPLNSSYR